MTRLYKYGKYEYLKDFLESGKIRINLASVYEDAENKAIQDNELKKEYIETSAGRSIITMDGKTIPCIGEGKVSYEKKREGKSRKIQQMGIYLPDTVCSSIPHIPARSAY